MAATILQWNARGLRCNRRDFDILIGEHQPDVICLQETKLEHSPPLSHYRCANYDGYCKSQRRNPDQLPCGGVLIYIKKGLYHRVIQVDSHLQAIAVQVTLGGTPITILSVYIPGNNHLTTRDLSNLIRNIRGQILIMGDFNGHNYMWGSHDVDTRGEIIERFTDKHNLCILNDGTHTYLKPQALHVNRPTSAIDLTISTPGLALRSVWEVLPDTHGSDHYPILTSILPSAAEIQPSCDPSHWVFSKANWEQFHDVCLESISEDILGEADPLHSFVEHVTKAANECIPRATTIPKKSNPWFDEECREALKARRALDKRVRHSRELRGETISAFRRSQAKARRLFNQKKRQSWAEYVSKLSAKTPIKHVWDRVRKLSGKNICPPKQYLNGKNGITITDPKDIANEHAAVFTDNSSSAHYSATFQAIKKQEERVKIDFTSDNTEVYNKPFRLRDLRRSIMKAKPRAPGPDGIHNNLLKHLPEDTLKILKEILNKIWISADFPQQWRAATVIPVPKPNKDHTDPLSYRPIALTSCLCKVLERMINARLIWYLEKHRILDRSQCGFRKHRSTTDHLVSLERYLQDAFAQRQQAVGLFFDLEKAYETTWQYGIIRDLHRIGLRGRLPVFVSEYLRDRRIRVRIGTTLSDEFYPEEGVPTGGVLAVTCFGLKINGLPSCIARDIFKALFVDDLAICFRGRSLDTIERHLQQAVNAIQEWATRNGFRFAAHKCKVIHFTAPRSRAQRPPIVRIGNTLLPVEESTKFLGLWWDSHLSFKKHISVLKTQCKEALNLIRVVAHLKWGGDRDTLLMLYRAIVRSKIDYGCIVYGTASNTSLRQLDSIHNSGLRLALGAFCTSPVSSLYTEANEAPLEERRLKLSMHYYVKTRACIDNPAHYALHEFDRTTRDLYAPRPNGRGGMTRPTAAPIGLKVEEAMTSAEINAELVCPLRTPNFPPGTHDYDPKRHDLIEGVSKCMISGQEAQAKFNEFREAQGSHDEVYTDGSKMNERVGAAAVINRHFQNGETTCRQLSKRLPDNSTIFAAEATAISLALNYYQHMGPVHHDVVVYSDSMSCLQAIEGEDTENPFICHIMNLLWSLSDKGTRVRFCWVPSHCGINGNERVDQLAKETLDQDIDPLASVHYTDMKPLVNSYIQKLVQTKWDVAVHGRDLYLVKPTLGPPKKFQHLTRAEEVVITRLRIGHTKATKSHILSRGPPTGCHYCGQTLTIDHMLLECALLQECRDEYYTVDSLNTLFETISETCIVEFLREVGFFYLIWCNLLTSTSPQYDQTWVIV